MTLDEVKEWADKFRVLAEQVGGKLFHELAAAFDHAGTVLGQQDAAAASADEEEAPRAKPKHR